jgi:serine/threonine-protein kinase
MLSKKNGRRDWVTVLDFGVAKVDEGVVDQQVLTAVGTAVGTLRYMPPEGVRGEPLGPDSDIYSLGLVAYELATGEPAISGSSQMQMAGELLSPKPFGWPDAANVSSGLKEVIQKMIHKDRKQRYQTTDDVRAVLPKA